MKTAAHDESDPCMFSGQGNALSSAVTNPTNRVPSACAAQQLTARYSHAGDCATTRQVEADLERRRRAERDGTALRQWRVRSTCAIERLCFPARYKSSAQARVESGRGLALAAVRVALRSAACAPRSRQ